MRSFILFCESTPLDGLRCFLLLPIFLDLSFLARLSSSTSLSLCVSSDPNPFNIATETSAAFMAATSFAPSPHIRTVFLHFCKQRITDFFNPGVALAMTDAQERFSAMSSSASFEPSSKTSSSAEPVAAIAHFPFWLSSMTRFTDASETFFSSVSSTGDPSFSLLACFTILHLSLAIPSTLVVSRIATRRSFIKPMVRPTERAESTASPVSMIDLIPPLSSSPMILLLLGRTEASKQANPEKSRPDDRVPFALIDSKSLLRRLLPADFACSMDASSHEMPFGNSWSLK
mmetsp:Transcript_2819/g.6624  ORF Transcript_2819/g.6624 Transcript_2819/m.6624 type:complete len:288 (+) Transcript_2819:2184-3047(+)